MISGTQKSFHQEAAEEPINTYEKIMQVHDLTLEQIYNVDETSLLGQFA
jgi:hypothetical protein